MDNYFENNDSENTAYHYRSEDLDSWNQWQPPKPPKKKVKGWTAGRVIALTLCASLLSGTLGAGGAVAYQILSRKDGPASQSSQDSNSLTILEGIRESTLIDIQQIDTSRLMTPAEVYAANVQSTVGITTSVTTNYWGYQTTSCL